MSRSTAASAGFTSRVVRVFDLDEAKYVLLPTNQIDLPSTIGRAEIARDHHVFELSYEEVGVLLALSPGTQVIRNVRG